MSWEVNWSAGRLGDKVAARNLTSRVRRVRDWHWVRIDVLTSRGIETPRYGTDWEVDWAKRRGNSVWARNPTSKKVAAREWRWVSKGTLITGGVEWKPFQLGRHLNNNGYFMLTRRALSEEDIALAIEHDLFQRNGRFDSVLEHRLVAIKKYGKLEKGQVVRHLNGDKTDNRPENLVTGTHKENHTDHRTAVLQMMYWRERAELAEQKLQELSSEKRD